MTTARVRTQNGRDFAIGGAVLALLLAGGSALYFATKYADTPNALVPWYAANLWLNVIVGVLVGAITGWFVGVSIPVGPRAAPDDTPPVMCPDCRWKNSATDRYCSQCGSSLY